MTSKSIWCQLSVNFKEGLERGIFLYLFMYTYFVIFSLSYRNLLSLPNGRTLTPKSIWCQLSVNFKEGFERGIFLYLFMYIFLSFSIFLIENPYPYQVVELPHLRALVVM